MASSESNLVGLAATTVVKALRPPAVPDPSDPLQVSFLDFFHYADPSSSLSQQLLVSLYHNIMRTDKGAEWLQSLFTNYEFHASLCRAMPSHKLGDYPHSIDATVAGGGVLFYLQFEVGHPSSILVYLIIC